MNPAERGWTVFCAEHPVESMVDMPDDLHDAVVDYFQEFARRAGAAVDTGAEPPGDAVDLAGIYFSAQMAGLPVIFEYVVVRDIREFRVTELYWQL